jgi:hypothetical protein
MSSNIYSTVSIYDPPAISFNITNFWKNNILHTIIHKKNYIKILPHATHYIEKTIYKNLKKTKEDLVKPNCTPSQLQVLELPTSTYGTE